MSQTPEQEPTLRKISYVKPAFDTSRAIVLLAGTDIQKAAVQLLKAGGRQGLHAHANYDGLYLVLEGRVRFSGKDGVFAEIGPKEAVVVPRGAAYGFEAVGGDAEMFFVSAVDPQIRPEFITHEPGARTPTYTFFNPDGEPAAAATSA